MHATVSCGPDGVEMVGDMVVVAVGTDEAATVRRLWIACWDVG